MSSPVFSAAPAKSVVRAIFAVATWMAALAYQHSQANSITDPSTVGTGRTGQDDPVRSRSAVEAVGRWVLDHYSDKQSAASGMLDVTKAPYSADSTGKRDATRAIQQAIKDARDARLVTFLPAGTYRVSDTLTCIQGVVTPDHWLFGQSAPFADPITVGESGFGYMSDYFPCSLMGSRTGQRSTIILTPRSAGFGDPEKPKPVIHFWARSESEDAGWWALSAGAQPDSKQPNPNEAEPPVSYNQLIVDVDLVLGKGNPGAVGIVHQGAQGSAIEDVNVDATGAFAGIEKAPGGGGGVHGLTVLGGRYGLYLKADPSGFYRGTQPVPVVSNVTLRDQTEQAVLYDGRGPLTIVGGRIEGAGVRAEGPRDAPWNGAMNLVDTVFRQRTGACAIASNHSVYLRNVYFERSKAIVCVEGQPELKAEPEHWSHIEEYAAGATLQYPPWLGEGVRQDAVYVDGRAASGVGGVHQLDSAPPPLDLQHRHAWPPPPPLLSRGVANVRAAPYGAKGDGNADDAAAIQRAIDENDAVFLPKGEYRLSRPLLLKSRTRLFGISNVLSVLSPMASPQFMDLTHPAPLVDTVDDPRASAELAFVELRVPVTQPAVYALRWRGGRQSVVRNIRAIPTAWEPQVPAALFPMIRIEGSGGGRWYDLYQDGWWFQGPDYRHLLVEGTREPLSFYMLNPEHARSDAQVELHDARNIDVYSLKAEGMYTVLWMHDCHNVRLYGYGGPAAPRPNWPLLRMDNSDDFLLANLDPDRMLSEPTLKSYWSALDMYSDAQSWLLVKEESGRSQAPVGVRGVEQVVLYKRGDPTNAQ